MDGQLGDPQEGPVDAHEMDCTGGERDAAGQPQIPVEPGVEQRSAVDLHAELSVPERPRVGSGLDAQVRRVGVGTDDGVPRGRVGTVGHPPRDERAALGEVPAAGHVGPGVGVVHLRPSRCVEPLRDGCDAVVRRRGLGDQVEHAAGGATRVLGVRHGPIIPGGDGVDPPHGGARAEPGAHGTVAIRCVCGGRLSWRGPCVTPWRPTCRSPCSSPCSPSGPPGSAWTWRAGPSPSPHPLLRPPRSALPHGARRRWRSC
jgi:hypothetical protein